MINNKPYRLILITQISISTCSFRHRLYSINNIRLQLNSMPSIVTMQACLRYEPNPKNGHNNPAHFHRKQKDLDR